MELRLSATKALLEAVTPWLDEEAFLGARARLRGSLVAARGHHERRAYVEALRLLEERRSWEARGIDRSERRS
jgi:hypothetical protein